MERNGGAAATATPSWEELLGSNNWSDLLSPLNETLRDHLLRCGSFCQIAGDSFISDSVGCGVGWGPGFGPEVIGYVGAGCGVGFSVGITLAGIGGGLPRNDLFQILYNATTTKAAPFDMAKSSTFIIMKGVAEDSLNFVAPHISFLRKETSWRLSKLKSNIHVQGTELNKLNTVVSKKIQSTLECLEAFKQNVWQPPKHR
ncbi:hypothetical protein ZIOFF_002746 [Zingiber officinale]|uniref:Uncharacterized protein n=1 Tax=Zingiber officinale TaxID=94328 RepID=A0A8J5I5M1_ZINOF|nr:hypothetical protein ZIOFF_002746 [Zingiber officinale]